MDIRIKQRLVGAVVLVSLAVIFIPMILQPPEDVRAPDTAIPPPPEVDFTNRLDEPVPEPQPMPAEPARQVLATPVPAPTPAPAPESAPAPVAPVPAAELSNAEEVAPVKEPPVATGPGAWVVQVGVFGQEKNAQELAGKLRAKGYTTFVERFAGKAGPSFRVRVGPARDRAAAEALQTRLKTGEKLPGMVKSYP